MWVRHLVGKECFEVAQLLLSFAIVKDPPGSKPGEVEPGVVKSHSENQYGACWVRLPMGNTESERRGLIPGRQSCLTGNRWLNFPSVSFLLHVTIHAERRSDSSAWSWNSLRGVTARASNIGSVWHR